MALVKCNDCGTEISTEAKACPKCGREQKHRSALGGLVRFTFLGLGILIAVGVVQSLFEQHSKDAAEQAKLAAMTPDQRAAYQAKAAEEKALGEVRYTCQEFIKRQLRSQLSAV
jgi:predicted nucleic acid-binding Zn ribbon protein